MPLKRFYEEFCTDCGKKQTGREESNNRIWWTPCLCKQIPGCPVDYPRLVSKKSVRNVIKCFEDLPPAFQKICELELKQATGE